MCVTAYVDFNLFELLTSKLKMKFELSDVQVKRGAGKIRKKMCRLRTRLCMYVHTNSH